MTSRENQAQGQAGMSGPAIIVFCGMLFTLSGFSVDIMLPAMGAIADELSASAGEAQATIPAFLATFAFGQILYGPLSDRFGRRPILFLGLAIYLIGAILAALAPTIETLLAGRGVQGFGAAAGPVLGRAILRDTHSGAALARALSFAMAIFAIGPIIAPLVGYFISLAAGWRMIFGSMLALAFGLLTVVLWRFLETNRSLNPNALKWRGVTEAVNRLFTHPQSRRFLWLASAAYCALMSYVVNSARVMRTSFGIEGFEFAALFGATGLGIILGQFGNRRLLARFGILPTMRIAGFILFAASGSALAFALSGALTGWSLMALMFVFNTSFLVVMSNALALVIDPHPEIAGSVSSIFGCATTLAGAGFVLATTEIFDGDVTAWGMGMTVMTALALAGLFLPNRTPLTIAARG